MRKIGVFGGSFNPIHMGHLIAAQEAMDVLKLDKVLFVPAGNPPHKSQNNLAAAEDRYNMVKLAIEGNVNFEASSIEMDRKGITYTYDTLLSLRSLYKEDRLSFIIGFDTLRELHTWKSIEKVFELTSFAVVNRGNEACEISKWIEERKRVYAGDITYVPIPEIGISSTDIRKRISDGRSVKYLVPDRVEQYIKARGLYLNDAKIQ